MTTNLTAEQQSRLNELRVYVDKKRREFYYENHERKDISAEEAKVLCTNVLSWLTLIEENQ